MNAGEIMLLTNTHFSFRITLEGRRLKIYVFVNFVSITQIHLYTSTKNERRNSSTTNTDAYPTI
jgi:hypothetical protein